MLTEYGCQIIIPWQLKSIGEVKYALRFTAEQTDIQIDIPLAVRSVQLADSFRCRQLFFYNKSPSPPQWGRCRRKATDRADKAMKVVISPTA